MGMRTDKKRKAETRKQYRTPRLVTYGSLQRLTMVKGGTFNDTPGKTKTAGGA